MSTDFEDHRPEKFDLRKDEVTAGAYEVYKKMKDSLNFITMPVERFEKLVKRNMYLTSEVSRIKREVKYLKYELEKRERIVVTPEFVPLSVIRRKYNPDCSEMFLRYAIKTGKLPHTIEKNRFYVDESKAYDLLKEKGYIK